MDKGPILSAGHCSVEKGITREKPEEIKLNRNNTRIYLR